jgi:hypothetical protein
MQMPHAFLKKVSAEASITLPAEKNYASGLVFLPSDQERGTDDQYPDRRPFGFGRQV